VNTAILRWIARLSSLALVTLFVAIAIGEGPPPLWPLSIHTLLFCLLVLCLAGLLVAWRWELVGGLIALAGIVGFYLVHFANTGFGHFPGGWVFPSMFVTGVLFVVAATIRNKHNTHLRTSAVPGARG
jgi:hypothetical protein